jgi:pimeloyl-ACP methyl ester carboxylesterase
LQLAAAYPNDIHGIILLSPNIAINDPNAWLLNDPWGLQIARLVKRSRYITTPDQRDIFKKYWYSYYRLEGVVALEEMLETTMLKETFRSIRQPLLLLYYYKDEKNQDKVVRVSAMKEMFASLGTPETLKKEVAMPNTEDHVIASPIKSKDVAGVQAEIEKFLTEVMKLPRR